MPTERREPSPTQRDDIYYRFLAGAAATRLLQSVVDLNLPQLLASKGALAADEIITALALQPKRGSKWLLELRHVGLLEELSDASSSPVKYRAGPLMRALFYADGRMEFFYQDFLRISLNAQALDLVQVLRGLPVPQIPYPPQTLAEAHALERWMRDTARETIATIEQAITFEGIQRLLDVAGGDGTMAIHFARRYPQLHVTVFNLPNSAYIARQNVVRAGAHERVTIVEGDFRHDPLPQGYDLVQFSRVLADWPEDVCRMLLDKAQHALVPGGRLLICEPLADDNPDLTVAWEYKYLHYDDFGVELYKPLATYERLLSQAGFHILQVNRKTPDTIHAVIVAQRQ